MREQAGNKQGQRQEQAKKDALPGQPGQRSNPQERECARDEEQPVQRSCEPDGEVADQAE